MCGFVGGSVDLWAGPWVCRFVGVGLCGWVSGCVNLWVDLWVAVNFVGGSCIFLSFNSLSSPSNFLQSYFGNGFVFSEIISNFVSSGCSARGMYINNVCVCMHVGVTCVCA